MSLPIDMNKAPHTKTLHALYGTRISLLFETYSCFPFVLFWSMHNRVFEHQWDLKADFVHSEKKCAIVCHYFDSWCPTGATSHPWLSRFSSMLLDGQLFCLTSGYEQVCRIWPHVVMNAEHIISLCRKPTMHFNVAFLRRSVYFHCFIFRWFTAF